MFAGGQHKHGVAVRDAIVPPLRTGYEAVIAQRTNDLFATTAKQDGKVTAVTKNAVVVEYKDGTEESVELGTRYGTVSGSTIPHVVKCDLKVGAKLRMGDLIAYNEGYFKVDPLFPKQALYKAGMLAKTAIVESSTTYEDACEINERLAGGLTTKTTIIRDVLINFEDSINNLPKLGTKLNSDDLLCTIEQGALADNDLFSSDSMDILRTLSTNAPTAKHQGTLERIEVFYHGDKEDMSDTVLKLVNQSDGERRRIAKETKKPVTTGKVDGRVRIVKDPLDLDQALVRFYITKEVGAGIGDKGVFGNQLKTIVSSVMHGTNTTEDGTPIDAKFSYLSISNRIVLSPEIMGTTNTLLMHMSKLIAKSYFGK